jgi:hypothetical protein
VRGEAAAPEAGKLHGHDSCKLAAGSGNRRMSWELEAVLSVPQSKNPRAVTQLQKYLVPVQSHSGTVCKDSMSSSYGPI